MSNDVLFEIDEGRSKIVDTMKEWDRLFPEPNQTASDENNLALRVRNLLITTYEVVFDFVKNSSATLKERKEASQKVLTDIFTQISSQEELLEKMLKTQRNQHDFNKNILESVKSLRVHQNEQNAKICHVMTRISERDLVIKHCGERLDELEKQNRKSGKRVRFSDVIDYNFQTNWSDLSEDLKLKCIEQMDFQDRLRLRSTAQTERRLVDSQRFVFDEINLFHSDSFIATWNNLKCTKYQLLPRTEFLKTPEEISRIQSLTSLLVYILKHCNIRNMSVEQLSGEHLSVLEELDDSIGNCSVRVKHFQAAAVSQTTKILLRKIWRKLESVSIEQYNVIGKELIAIPSIYSAKMMVLVNGQGWRRLLPLVRNFMSRNGEIGSKLVIHCLDKTLFDTVISDNCCRVVAHRQHKEFVISSFNIHKDILVKYKNGRMEVTVIPSEI